MSPRNMPMKAQKGSRGIAVLMFNFSARLGWVVKATPRPLHPRERVTLHIVQWAERAVGLIWMDVEKRQSLTFVQDHTLRNKKAL